MSQPHQHSSDNSLWAVGCCGCTEVRNIFQLEKHHEHPQEIPQPMKPPGQHRTIKLQRPPWWSLAWLSFQAQTLWTEVIWQEICNSHKWKCDVYVFSDKFFQFFTKSEASKKPNSWGNSPNTFVLLLLLLFESHFLQKQLYLSWIEGEKLGKSNSLSSVNLGAFLRDNCC